jgi:hypothetical protein
LTIRFCSSVLLMLPPSPRTGMAPAYAIVNIINISPITITMATASCLLFLKGYPSVLIILICYERLAFK